jgi:CheY-like chemotaxis protein
MVIGDELRLQQVLLNLMSNAVKFTNSGNVRLSAQALAAPGGDRWLLTFQIDDQGPGVTLTDQQQLFRPYVQGRAAAPSDTKGTGLGLYLSRMLVEQMGGEIGVRNRPEGGAQFWFSLTLQQAPSSAANSAAARSPAMRPTELALRGRTVWVVDDGRLNREVARRVVETHGGQCRLFDSAQAFLDHAGAAEQPADVVLMDIEMPELDGVSASRALRELPQWADVPVIAVTGQDSERVAEALRGHDLTDFVLKPFHAQTLLKTIQTQLMPPEH